MMNNEEAKAYAQKELEPFKDVFNSGESVDVAKVSQMEEVLQKIFNHFHSVGYVIYDDYTKMIMQTVHVGIRDGQVMSIPVYMLRR